MKTTSSEVKFDAGVNTTDHWSGHCGSILPNAMFVGTASEGHCTGTVVKRPEEMIHCLVGDKKRLGFVEFVQKLDSTSTVVGVLKKGPVVKRTACPGVFNTTCMEDGKGAYKHPELRIC